MIKIPEDFNLSFDNFLKLITAEVAYKLACEGMNIVGNLEDHRDYEERWAKYTKAFLDTKAERSRVIQEVLGHFSNSEMVWEGFKDEIMGSNRRNCPTCATKLGGAIGFD